MNRLCTCGHTLRIHGRPWIPDDNCRAFNHLDGPCGCDEFLQTPNTTEGAPHD